MNGICTAGAGGWAVPLTCAMVQPSACQNWPSFSVCGQIGRRAWSDEQGGVQVVADQARKVWKQAGAARSGDDGVQTLSEQRVARRREARCSGAVRIEQVRTASRSPSRGLMEYVGDG
jgi:hypothetical protein